MIKIDIEKKLKAYQGTQVLKIATQFETGSITKIYGQTLLLSAGEVFGFVGG